MDIGYNLTFCKSNISGKTILEKEGELLLHEKGFQLKGKGAFDKGEVIHFSDIESFQIQRDQLEILTFFHFRYTLSHFGNLFEQFVRDLYRVRNEFLIESLFLRQGKLMREYDGAFEYFDSEGSSLFKTTGKIRLYEQSLVIIPKDRDVFSFSFLFLKSHEFDEDEYRVKIIAEDGVSVVLSQLGNDFEDFQEHFLEIFATMYTEILKEFQNFFVSHKSELLVKLAKCMKRGKAVSLKELQKVDKDLAKSIEDSIFKDEIFLNTVSFLKKEAQPENIFLGMNMKDGKKDIYFFSVFFALPKRNLMTCTIGSYEGDLRKVQDTYFFRLSDERLNGDSESAIAQKVFDLNQALTLFHFIPDPFYKDKKELQKSLYRLAIQRLSFLKNLRSSFLGRCPSILPDLFLRNLEKFQNIAKIAEHESPPEPPREAAEQGGHGI